MNKNLLDIKEGSFLAIFVGIIMTGILLFSVVMTVKSNYLASEITEEKQSNVTGEKQPENNLTETSAYKYIDTSSEEVTAKGSSSVTLDARTGKVLSGENQDARLPMASTTKIVTALVAIENGKINEYVTIDKKAVGIEGSSIYLKEGQKWKLLDLLYGLMLRSGNDSAEMIAIAIGGTRENFIVMMNEMAKSLGLQNTNFTNPSGLHDANHYTSAYDLGMLTARAYKHKLFEKIVSTKRHITDTVFEADGKETKVEFFNKNKMLNMIGGANGVKTGFTKNAGRCLVSAVKRDNIQLVCVVLNIGDMWNYSKYLLENAVGKYEKVTIAKAGETVGYFRLKQTACGLYPAIVQEDLCIYRLKGESSELEYKFLQRKNVYAAPLEKGVTVGQLLIFQSKQLIFSAKAYSINDIQNINDEIKVRPL